MKLDSITQIIELLCAAAACGSVGYYGVCLWGAVSFLRERGKAGKGDYPIQLPPVSILKPLKGSDPEMYESFRSHCQQDYPEFEIVFGVSETDDPAIAEVERLRREFPSLPIRLVICEKRLGTNTKVSNLAQMVEFAQNELLVVNDSDIRVQHDYLRHVVPGLSEPRVGMVTCLYRGVAVSTLGSRLEALGISSDFSAGVLAARQLQGIRFGLGSTVAFRRTDLQAIGGFDSLADYLADDYELGRRIADLERTVNLSDTVVQTFLPAYSLRAFMQHQIRWARTIRDVRPAGYAGLGITFGLIWAALTVVLSHGAWRAWGLLAAVAFMRAAMALVVGRYVLGDAQVVRYLWLVPVRDLLAMGVWIASFAGHRVSWRGQWFTLKRGKLVRSPS